MNEEIREEIYEKICDRVVKRLNAQRENLTLETKFVADLGGKSLEYAQMAQYLNAEYDVEMPYLKFSKLETLGEMVDYVVEEMGY